MYMFTHKERKYMALIYNIAEGRNVGRDMKLTDTAAVLWFQKCVFQGMSESLYAGIVPSVVTSFCPALHHSICFHFVWPNP